MTPKIILETDSLIAINKPAGITVNNAETTKAHETVQDWIQANYKFAKNFDAASSQSEFINRAGIVHRLDKETSGILLIAKNENTFTNLQKQFKDRIVKKVYFALAHGKVTPTEGEINVPVGRLPWNRKQFGIIPGGKESKTMYKVLKYYDDPSSTDQLSFVELYPQSGRTHQIRVHMKYIGHPIYSDFLYAGRKTSRNDRKNLSRVFLHAAKISFINPASGDLIELESDLPDELVQFLESLTPSQ